MSRETLGDKIRTNLKMPVMYAGLVGFGVVLFSMSSAIPRLPGTTLNAYNALTPLVSVELARSKAELEHALGPSGSDVRSFILNKPWWDWDLVPNLLIFILVAHRMFIRVADKKPFIVAVVLYAAAWFATLQLPSRVIAAASAGAISDEMFQGIQIMAQLKWITVFASFVVLGTAFFFTRGISRICAIAISLSSLTGLAGVASNYIAWFGPSLLVMFISLSGLGSAFLIDPSSIYKNAFLKGRSKWRRSPA